MLRQDYNLDSHIISVIRVYFMHEWRDLQIKILPIDRFLRNFFMAYYIFSEFLQEICWETVMHQLRYLDQNGIRQNIFPWQRTRFLAESLSVNKNWNEKENLQFGVDYWLHQSCINYIHCITLHCITLHCITLHCIILHCIILYCITLHCITLHYIALHCITLHYIALHCITLHHIALHCITLHYIILHYITLHYITLHYIIYFTLHKQWKSRYFFIYIQCLFFYLFINYNT